MTSVCNLTLIRPNSSIDTLLYNAANMIDCIITSSQPSHLSLSSSLNDCIIDSIYTCVDPNFQPAPSSDSTFVLFNARSICNKLNELNVLINSVKPSFVAITETWLNNTVPDSLLDQSNLYSVFRHDRPSRGGAVCLLISNLFRCIQIPVELDLIGVEIVCVDIYCKHELIRIIVCYRSTSLARASIELNNRLVHCINKLSHVRHSVLLVGDFNLPHINWYTNHIPKDLMHQTFLECFSCNGFSQLNNFSTRGDAILDLVLTNEPNLIGNIEIQAPLGAGDHDIILFPLIILPSHLPDSSHTTDPVRNFAKCNFDLINSDLDQIDWNVVFSGCTSSDDYWTTFLTVINKSIDLHCPRFPPNLNPKRKRFVYPSEIKRLQAFKKRAWRRLRASPPCE